MNETQHSVTPLSSLEISGAICARVIHDLANLVSGIMGNAAGDERRRPEGHPYLRLTRMLEPGVVVTVEPGIYFIDSLLAVVRARDLEVHLALLKPLETRNSTRRAVAARTRDLIVRSTANPLVAIAPAPR